MYSKSFGFFLTLVLSIAVISSCSQSNTHRQDQRSENEANTIAAMNDLAPAEGEFSGYMYMIKSKKKYRVNLTIKRVYENYRETNEEDPTQTINIPKLNGNLRFADLDNALDKTDASAEQKYSDYKKYSELIDPMGGFSTALFDYGDYDPDTNILVLPYSVSGYSQSSFGELQGTLKDGVFTGTWFAKPLGVVGKFKLTQINTDGDDQ